jgi:hypothetical protein
LINIFHLIDNFGDLMKNKIGLILIVIIVFSFTSISVSAINLNDITSENVSANFSFTSPTDIKLFKDSCKYINYNEIVKINPYNFQGVHIKYTGIVLNFEPSTEYTIPTFDLAINGNRNQIIHFYFEGNENINDKIKNNENITIWGLIDGDKNYGESDLSEGMTYSGSTVTYGSYDSYGYSMGGHYGSFGHSIVKGSDPQYNDFYTSLDDYKFQPDAFAWYLKINR